MCIYINLYTHTHIHTHTHTHIYICIYKSNDWRIELSNICPLLFDEMV